MTSILIMLLNDSSDIAIWEARDVALRERRYVAISRCRDNYIFFLSAHFGRINSSWIAGRNMSQILQILPITRYRENGKIVDCRYRDNAISLCRWPNLEVESYGNKNPRHRGW